MRLLPLDISGLQYRFDHHRKAQQPGNQSSLTVPDNKIWVVGFDCSEKLTTRGEQINSESLCEIKACQTAQSSGIKLRAVALVILKRTFDTDQPYAVGR